MHVRLERNRSQGKMNKRFLRPTEYCESDNPEIIQLARHLTANCNYDLERAIAIFNYVRDEIKYRFDHWNIRASTTLERKSGMCANKANLQVALLRATGIPAGYGSMIIKKEALRPVATDELYDLTTDVTNHIYCQCFVGDKWTRADTTVDRELFQAAYTNKEGGEYLEWKGVEDIQMSRLFIIDDLGLHYSMDKLLKEKRFLGYEVLRRANEHIEQLLKKAMKL